MDVQIIASAPHPGFVITTVHPVRVFGTPKMEITFFDRWKSREVDRFFNFGNYNGTDMRLFAGQIDAKDPSHFTVQVHLDEKREVIEGRLLDDGAVTLAFRGIPASITDWRAAQSTADITPLLSPQAHSCPSSTSQSLPSFPLAPFGIADEAPSGCESSDPA